MKAINYQHNKKAANSMPTTRIELFCSSFSARFGSFILPNLFCTLFYIPLFLWLFFCLSTFLLADAETVVLASDTLWLLCIGFCICISMEGPIKCGITKLMIAWSRNDSCSRMATLLCSIKDNWKKSVLFSLVNALLFFISFGASYYYMTGFAESQGVRFIGIVFSFLLSILVLLMQQSIYAMIVTYEIPLSGLLKNALLLAIVEFAKGFGILILRFLPSLLLLLSFFIFPKAISLVFLAYILYYLLIGFSVDHFICASFSNYLMEKHINIKIPGAHVNIGMDSEYVVQLKEQSNG